MSDPLGLGPVDELFGLDEDFAEKVIRMDPTLIDPFPNHPFNVKVDEVFLEKIRRRGVTQPTIIRPSPKHEGRYQMVAGHRRQASAIKLGYDLPVIIRNLSDSEAIIEMAESNLTSREVILHSEKARAYKMAAEAEKKQGYRSDLTSGHDGLKINTTEKIGEIFGDYERDVRRYIKLNDLIPEILDMVDEGIIKMRPAEPLASLKDEEQKQLLSFMESDEVTPSVSQAIEMKKLSEKGDLNEEAILFIMTKQKPNQREQFKIPQEKLKPYFPEGTPREKVETTIITALDFYRKYKNKIRKPKEPER